VNIIALTLLATLTSGETSLDINEDKVEKPLVIACYYTWYTTLDGPHKRWGAWGSDKPSDFSATGSNPDQLIFPPHIRDISASAYPLVGLYDSDDPEIVRWHIQLAKAAGIDAFFVDWWGAAGWQQPPGYTHDVFVNVVLPIAEEEDFKVCLFDETAQFYHDLNTVKEWAAGYLAQFKDNPAYLHIEGKPVYGIYQVPFDPRLTPEEATSIRDYVEERVGPVYWILDKIANGENPITGKYGFMIPEEWIALDWVDAFMGYGTFSVQRIHTYEELAPQYAGMAKQIQRAGKAAILPLHPGLDNSRLQEGSYIIPRKQGDTLRAYIRAATDAGADALILTSFNEWPETTVVEPAMTWDDPYRYLKILADWKGLDFTPPPVPENRVLLRLDLATP